MPWRIIRNKSEYHEDTHLSELRVEKQSISFDIGITRFHGIGEIFKDANQAVTFLSKQATHPERSRPIIISCGNWR